MVSKAFQPKQTMSVDHLKQNDTILIMIPRKEYSY